MKKKYLYRAFAVLALLVFQTGGCGLPMEQTGDSKRIEGSRKQSETTDSETESSAEATTAPAANIPVVQNEKYGISLPQSEKFGEELKDLIYWENATNIYKYDTGVYSDLKAAGLLDKDIPVQLYYHEEDCRDYDELESNFYSVVIYIPQLSQGKDSDNIGWYELRCNSRGLQSVIDDFEWEDEKEKSQYTEYGNIILHLSEQEANAYQKPSLSAEEEQEKDAILKKIKKEITRYKGDDIYIHDFRPADTDISGCIIFHDTNSEVYMPYGWIHGGIRYSGKKMSKGPYVFFEYRVTTAFNGGGYSKEAAIRLAKEQKEDIILENCLLACRVKKNKLVPLQ